MGSSATCYAYAAPAIDPSASLLAVSNDCSDSVDIISALTGALVASVQVCASNVAYDPVTGYFFTLTCTGEIVGFLPASGLVQVSYPSYSSCPTDLLATGSNGVLVVSDACNSDLVFIDSSNGAELGTAPWFLAFGAENDGVYDPVNGELYYPDPYIPAIGVFSLSGMDQVTQINDPSFSCPYYPVVDPLDGVVFIGDNCADLVFEVTTSNTVAASAPGVGDECEADGTFSVLTQYVYYSDFCSDSEEVFDPQSSSWLAPIPTSDTPFWPIAMSTSPGSIFVPTDGDLIVVIQPAGGTVSTISTPAPCPIPEVYDPGTNQIFAADACGTGLVDVLDPTTNTVVSTISTSLECPDQGAYDAADDAVWFLDYCTDNVVEISDVSDTQVATVGISQLECPDGFADDAEVPTLYISDDCTDSVYALNTTTLEVSTFLSGACFAELAVDAALGALYVDDCSSGYLDVYGASTAILSASGYTEDYCGGPLTVDPVDGLLLQLNYCSDEFSAISISTVTVDWQLPALAECPDGIAFDPQNDYAYIPYGCAPEMTPVSIAGESDGAAFPVAAAGTGYLEDVIVDPVNGDLYATFDLYSEDEFEILLVTPTSDVVGSSIVLPTSALCAPSPTMDPDNGMLYVTDGCSSEIQVVNPLSGAVVGFVGLPGGSYAGQELFDPDNGLLYVTDQDNPQLIVVDPQLGMVLTTIPLPYEGWSMALDATASLLFISSPGNSQIDVVSTGSESLLYAVTVGGGEGCPYQVAFDPQTNMAYAGDPCYGEVDVVNTLGVLEPSADPAGSECPYAIVYDPSDAELLLGDECTDDLYVYSPSTLTTTNTVPNFPCTWWMTLDPQNGLLYAPALCGGGSTSVVSPSADTILETLDTPEPLPGTYDAQTGEIILGSYDGALSRISTELTTSAPTTSTGSWETAPTLPYSATCAALFSVVVGNDLISSDGCANQLDSLDLADPGAGVVASPSPLGGSDWGLVYDPVSGLLYNLDSGTGAVQVWSPSGPSFLGSINLGGCGYGLAVDGAGNLWVSDPCDYNVVEIDTTTNSVVATISGFDAGYTMQFDPDNGLLYDASYDGNIYVIDPTTNSVEGSFAGPIPLYCAYWSAFANVEGGVMAIADECIGTVEVFALAAQSLVQTFNFGGCATGLAFDPVGMDLLAPNVCNGQLNAVNVLTSTVTTFGTCLPYAVAVDASNDTWWEESGCGFILPIEFVQDTTAYPAATYDVGQLIQVDTTLWGLGALSDASTLSALPNVGSLSCSFSVGGPDALRQLTGFCAFSEPGNYTLWVTTTDADGNTVSAWVSVQIMPAVSAITPLESTSSADTGQSASFTAQVYGGTGTYTQYLWSGLPNGCPVGPTTTATVTCLLGATASATVTTVQVQTIDSAGLESAVSPGISFTLDPDPSITSLGATTPTQLGGTSFADVGDSLTFTGTSNWASSTATFGYSWTGLPSGCSSSNSLTISCVATFVGFSDVVLQVVDSNGVGALSSPLAFTVYPTLVAGMFSASEPAGDVGQTVVFSANPSGGAGGNTYAWTGGLSDCSSATAPTITCFLQYADEGTHVVFYTVTDAAGDSVSSGSLSFVVNSDPWLTTPTPSSASGDVGQTVAFSTVATSASAVTYSWTGLPGVCTGTSSATVACDLTTSGVYLIGVSLTDAYGFTNTSAATLTFTVSSDPTVLAPSASSGIDVGQSGSVAFTASASGGTGTFTYTWSGLPAGCTGTATALATCAASDFTTSGTYAITYQAMDSNGVASAWSGALLFVVSPALAASTPSASSAGADAGETATFSALPSGGSGGYAVVWSGLPASCPTNVGSSITCTFLASDVGPAYTISYVVTDSNSNTATSGTLSFVVSPAAATSTPSPSAASGDVGQTVSFTTTSSGGSGTYVSYAWTGLPGSCTGTTTSTVTCLLTSAGPFTIGVSMMDSNGGGALSGTRSFTVWSDPSAATPVSTLAAIDLGQAGSVVFSETASGGTGTYTSYAWSGLPSGCTGTSTATTTCGDSTFTAEGVYAVTVSVVDSNGVVSQASSALLFTVDPALMVSAPTASASGADVGQSTTFTAPVRGGSGSEVFSWSGLPAGCPLVSTASFACTFTAASVGTYTISYTVADHNGNTGTAGGLTFVVYVDPTAAAPVPSQFSADIGQTVSFLSAAIGGSGTYAGWSWSGIGFGTCSGTSSNHLVCTVTSGGVWSVSVAVTDSFAEVSLPSGATSFDTWSDPTVATPTASPGSIDVGESGSVDFTATTTDGSGGFAYVWTGLPSGCTGTTTATPSCADSKFTTAGTLLLTVDATDSNGVSSGPSAALEFVVAPTLTASTPAASAVGADVGQSTTFTAAAGGGSGGDSFTWSGLPLSCPASVAASVACTFGVPNVGPYTISYSVADANGVSVTSGNLAFTVHALPTASLPVASAAAGDVGQTVSFTTSASLGSGTYVSYAWSGLPGVCAGASTASPSCDLTTAGTYTVSVSATDSLGGTGATSSTLSFTVNHDPTIALPGDSAASIDLGQSGSVVFSTTASGGSGSYPTYAWSGLPVGCTGTATATATCADSTFTSTGNYLVTVEASDSLGVSTGWSSALLFTVEPAFSSAALSANVAGADVGQSATFTASVSGGSGGVSFTWSGLPGSCPSATTSSVTCTFLVSDVGSHSVSVTATDGNANTVSAGPLTFVVSTDPAASLPVASAASGDLGQSIVFSEAASGGTGTYTSYLWSGLPGTCSGTTTSTATCLLTAAATVSITVQATDSNGKTSALSSALSFQAFVDPSVGVPSESVAAIDLGMSGTATFTATPSGGSGSYTTFAWSGLPAGCTGTTTGTASCAYSTFAATGTYLVSADAADTNGATSSWSSPVAFAVDLALSNPALSASATNADVGQTVAFTASPSGGAGPYTFSWSGLPAGCSGVHTASVSCALVAGSVGSHTVASTVSDANGNSATSPSATLVVNVDPSVSTPVASASAGDVGQTVVFVTTASGGSGIYPSYAWTGLPATCAGASGSSATCVLNAATTLTVHVSATDSDGVASALSSALTFVVSSAPSAAVPSASVASVDVGQAGSVVFTAAASGGASPYTYAWSGLPSGCSGLTTATVACPGSSFVAPVGLLVSYLATDANGVSTPASPQLVFPVFSDPSATTPTANRTAADLGQWVGLSTVATGGSGGYTYLWTGLPASCGTPATSQVSCQALAAGTWTISVSATDSNGVVASSGPLSLTVNGALALTAPTAKVGGTLGATAADAGELVAISTSASGGSGSYTYRWSGIPETASCLGGSSATLDCTFGAAGTVVVNVTVVDSLGGLGYAPAQLTLTISSASSSSSATVSASASALDATQPLTLKASVSGGAAPWTFTWSGLPVGCSGVKATITCDPSTPGLYLVSFTATDANGANVSSSATAVQVNALPTVGISASATSATTGTAITFLASGSGGTGVLSYSWSFGDGSGGTGASTSHVYTIAGTQTVTVTVKDATGATGTATLTVSITTPAAGSPQVLGTSAAAGYLTVAALVIGLLAVVLVLLLLARRRGGGTSAPAPVEEKRGGGPSAEATSQPEAASTPPSPSPAPVSEGAAADSGAAASGSPGSTDYNEDNA